MAKQRHEATGAGEPLTLFQAVERLEVELRQQLDPSQHERLSCAVALVRAGAVLEESPGHWTVTSSTDPQRRYAVDRECSCEDALHRAPEGRCKHRLAKGLMVRALRLLETGDLAMERVNVHTGELEPAPSSPLGTDTFGNDGWDEAMTMSTDPGALSERPCAVPAIRLGLRPISVIIADLSRPLPKECIGTLPKGGSTISFLPWHTVAAVLDTYAPGWDGEVARVDTIGERVSVTYRIRIPCAEGWAVREDSGMEDAQEDEYGDAMTNATATAFKRAAAKFGVGRSLYDTKSHTDHFLARVRGDREKLLVAIAEKAPAADLLFETLVADLMAQSGAYNRALLPVWALRSTLAQLQRLIADHQ